MLLNVVFTCVYRECAEILEHMKQLGEAGQLYEAAQYYDKADTPHLRVTSINNF